MFLDSSFPDDPRPATDRWSLKVEMAAVARERVQDQPEEYGATSTLGNIEAPGALSEHER